MPYLRIRMFRRALVPGSLASIGGVLAIFAASAFAPTPAAAQVTRCERPDGSAAFTDRGCAAVGAAERAAGGDRPGRRMYRGGCARNVQDLLFEMTSAIDARDANRLAGVYHWTGMSSRGAVDVMARLDDVVRKPLVDIVQVLPSARQPAWFAAEGGEPDGANGWASVDTATVSIGGPAAPAVGGPSVSTRDYQYPSTVDQTPVALRLVQTLDNGTTPSETTFDLHHHFGCVWIKAG